MILKDSKIYIAGHNGMVGSAILRKLKNEGYENIILKTLDGIIYSGFLLEDTKNNLIIRQLNGITKILSKKNIVSTTMTGVSLMPMGLIDGLSDDEIRNLFAYLRSTTPPF